MFSLNKVLAPIDFSERAIGAARYAEALAEHFGSELVLLHVLPPPQYEFATMEIGGEVLTDLFETRVKQVRGELEAFARNELPDLQALRILLEGDPATKIAEYARNEQVNLVVVPTHGHGTFRRFIVGSVTAKILHDADCPVWTGVHLEDAPPVERIVPKTVMVAVDLGDQSERTLNWASEFAQSWEARLILIHATPKLNTGGIEGAGMDCQQPLIDQAKAEIESLQQRAGTDVEVMVEDGEAPEVVSNAAAQVHADLLVIGRGSSSGVFGRLRTNAYSIIRQSPCPVVSV